MNNVANTEVNLLKKLPTDLDDVKLSCETPKPKAPPSDRWSRIVIIRITASIIFIDIKTIKIEPIFYKLRNVWIVVMHTQYVLDVDNYFTPKMSFIYLVLMNLFSTFGSIDDLNPHR